jgi:2-keto-3-deoxy-L-rhamnonate aldolase RhmA
MAILSNQMKAAMSAGKLATGLGVNRWRRVDAAGIAKAAGFEWLFLDLEHSVLSEEMASQMSVAALMAGVTPIARVGTDQFYQAARLLDAGAQGIVFPHVDDAKRAKQAAMATKYPPLGSRSLGGLMAQTEFANAADPASMAALNRETLTIVMIETQQALDNAAAIAAVDGVDALLIGTNDLAADLGIPGKLGDDKIAAAYQTVAKACKGAGKFFGMGGVYSKDLIQRYLKTGVQFMLGGADIAFMLDGAKARREMIRGVT